MVVERRKFTRVPFDGACEIDGDFEPVFGELADVSLRGALIETFQPPSIVRGQTCQVKVCFTSSNIELNMDALVAHIHPKRVGVEFIGLDIDTLTHLRRIIEFNLGDPDKALEELFHWPDQ